MSETMHSIGQHINVLKQELAALAYPTWNMPFALIGKRLKVEIAVVVRAVRRQHGVNYTQHLVCYSHNSLAVAFAPFRDECCLEAGVFRLDSGLCAFNHNGFYRFQAVRTL